MSADAFWSEVVGQEAAIRVVEHVTSPEGVDDVAHAWLITGPPGSGRTTLAYRFAAALIAREPSERDAVYDLVSERTHPDLDVLTTEGVVISIDSARELVRRANLGPSQGRFRVVVVEDADRLPERTSNTLLKVLEEPPATTVWMLCAPSEADMLPTIRSRTRSLRLVTPSVEDVQRLLEERDGIPARDAERAARLAQSHIGMARTLALNPDALERRQRTIDIALGVDTLSGAMASAKELFDIGVADAQAMLEQRDEAERDSFIRNLGLTPGESIPPRLRRELRELEDDQKRRARRSTMDGVDRILTDLLSLYRDALMVALDTGAQLVNVDHETPIRALADRLGRRRVLERLAAIETARERLLDYGVQPQLVLEALLASWIQDPA